jgi:beta-phosphoglucomutase-like phosphatase (HAD superfamily)
MDESDLSRCGYFFDFDGVLVNSVGIKTEAFESMFKRFGPEVLHRVLEHHRHHGGISRVDKIQYSHTHFVEESRFQSRNWSAGQSIIPIWFLKG